MRCVWATSLRLTWGVLALRMVIENMREWVNRQVRPELVKWISAALGCPPPTVFLSPGDGHIEQRRRAVSLDPPRSDLSVRSSDFPCRSPRFRGTPALFRIETAPTCVDVPEDRESNETEVDDVQPSKQILEYSDSSQDEEEADEGYINARGHHNVEEVSDCEVTEDINALSKRFENTCQVGLSVHTHHSGLQREQYVDQCAAFCDCSHCLRKLGRNYRLRPRR
jgi:hypothetical protein